MVCLILEVLQYILDVGQILFLQIVEICPAVTWEGIITELGLSKQMI